MHALRKRYFGVLFGAVVFVVMLVLMTAPAAESQRIGSCFGENPTRGGVGTNGDDNITGTFGRDVIKTFAGNDTVRGEANFAGEPGGARDLICLGDGADTADGAAKSDRIKGGPGNDTLDGDNFPSPFGDFLYGEAGDDTFTGGQGNDVIRGGTGNDMIDNGAGTTINQGADNVEGGPGDDTINEASDGSIDTIKGGDGEDTCIVDPADKTRGCEIRMTTPTGA